mmetsp:Transcript_14757/g.23247  ORF Transcript_14757/g.23247 Transcript_14757/m.23247 type:complete len:115 (+) Transcript_14757:139-483(+)
MLRLLLIHLKEVLLQKIRKLLKYFRIFGKKKSELWQMNDGSIVHAVNWEVETGREHLVPKKQITYLVETHFGISETSINIVVDQVDPILFAIFEKTKKITNTINCQYAPRSRIR